MNKKGFTTIELIVSFTLISIMLVTLMGVIVNYRNRVMEESIKTELLDFKNSVTKMIYDDIIHGKYVRMLPCQDKKCVKLIDEEGMEHELKIIDNHLIYQNIKYALPGGKKLIIGDFEFSSDLGMSHLKIPMKYQDFSSDYSILININ